MRRLSTAFFLIAILVIAGCGGGKHSPTTLGVVSLTVHWPESSDSTVESVRIILANGESIVSERLIDRQPASISIIRFEDLPAGEYTASVTMHALARGDGPIQTEGKTSLSVRVGYISSVTFTPSAEVWRLTVLPSTPSIKTGNSVQLTATAFSESDEVVLLPPNSIVWNSLDPAVAVVDAQGLASGIAVGTASIQVVHPDSGRGASIELRVTDALWTLLIYMAADNNLEPYAIQDLNELEIVGSSDEVSVVVQIDRSPGYDTTNGDWTTTRRYYVTRDTDVVNIKSQLIEDLGEQDMANTQTLADFVNWGMQSYPADQYLLVLWNHGRGWRTRTLAEGTREVKAIHIDDTSGTEMSLEHLRTAFLQFPKVDVVLFDACLMAMLEVAYSLRGELDYMVASEENIDVQGQQYNRLLAKLSANPYMSPALLATSIVDEYIDHYSAVSGGTYTLSALNMASLDQLVSATDQFAGALLANMPAIRDEVRTAQAAAQRFDNDAHTYRYYKDLHHFAKLINENENIQGATVKSSAADVMSAVANAVTYQRSYGSLVKNANGVSIYLPDPGTVLSQYYTLDFARDTRWDEFISAY